MDVGAHIGLFSLMAAARWPAVPILALEPHPRNAAWARRNLSGNGAAAVVLESAASDRKGFMRFASGNGMGSLNEEGDVKSHDGGSSSPGGSDAGGQHAAENGH